MKFLNPTVHGVVDYALGALLLLAPLLFGFTGVVAILCYVLGAGHISYSLITRYPLSILKLIPFPVHGVIESVAAVVLLAAPWLFDFAHDALARNFFVVNAIAVGIVVAVTRYRTVPEEEQARTGRAQVSART